MTFHKMHIIGHEAIYFMLEKNHAKKVSHLDLYYNPKKYEIKKKNPDLFRTFHRICQCHSKYSKLIGLYPGD